MPLSRPIRLASCLACLCAALRNDESEVLTKLESFEDRGPAADAASQPQERVVCNLGSGNDGEEFKSISDGCGGNITRFDHPEWDLFVVAKGFSLELLGRSCGSGLKTELVKDATYEKHNRLPDYNHVTDPGANICGLGPITFILESGASLRLENVSFGGLIWVSAGEEAKIEIVNSHIHNSRYREPEWLRVMPGANVQVMVTHSRIWEATLSAERSKVSVRFTDTTLDVFTGLYTFNSTCTVVMKKVRANCGVKCVWQRGGKIALRVADSFINSTSAIYADSKSGLSVAIQNSGLRGRNTGTAVEVHGDGSQARSRLFLTRVDIVGFDKGVVADDVNVQMTHVNIIHAARYGLVLRRGTVQANDLVVVGCFSPALSFDDPAGHVWGTLLLNFDSWYQPGKVTVHDSTYRLLPGTWGLWTYAAAACAASAFGTLCLQWSVKMHFLHSDRTKCVAFSSWYASMLPSWCASSAQTRGPSFGSVIYAAAGTGVLFWLFSAAFPLQICSDMYDMVQILNESGVNHVWTEYGIMGFLTRNYSRIETPFGAYLSLVLVAAVYLYITVWTQIDNFKLAAERTQAKILQEEKDALKKGLDNLELRADMAYNQNQIFRWLLLEENTKVVAAKIFEEMHDKAKKEKARIAKWIDQRRGWYSIEDNGMRMLQLEAIESEPSVPVQPPLPKSITDAKEPEKEAVEFLYRVGSWLRGSFQKELRALCQEVNGVKSKDDLVSLVGSTELHFDPIWHPMQPNPQAEVGVHVGLLVAPVKSKERAQDKINNDYVEKVDAGKPAPPAKPALTDAGEPALPDAGNAAPPDASKPAPRYPEKPAARYVCDFLRATIFAADPFVLAIAFRLLKQRFKVVRVKNKFGDNTLATDLRTNLLVNVRIRHDGLGLEHVGEVQFLLQDYLTAKDLQHLYYDVERASSAGELLDKPIFA